jgi:hypothetical protein
MPAQPAKRRHARYSAKRDGQRAQTARPYTSMRIHTCAAAVLTDGASRSRSARSPTCEHHPGSAHASKLHTPPGAWGTMVLIESQPFGAGPGVLAHRRAALRVILPSAGDCRWTGIQAQGTRPARAPARLRRDRNRPPLTPIPAWPMQVLDPWLDPSGGPRTTKPPLPRGFCVIGAPRFEDLR